jgi:hypothetical protein
MMNDESSRSSSTKHVSFSALVDVIEDSAFEYVDLPPIIFESFDESDSVMSFTDLTESSISDRYYEAQQSLSEITAMEKENKYSAFGETSLTSMSFNDLYDSSGPMKDSSVSLEEASAAVPAVYNQADLDKTQNDSNNAATVAGDSKNDDDDDDDEEDKYPKHAGTPWYCCVLGMLSSMMGMIGMCFHCLNSQLSPTNTDDVAALTHVSAGTGNGFFLPALAADGGATYITYDMNY